MTAAEPSGSTSPTQSLTLDRGLTALEVLAEEPEGLTVTELARQLDTHRAGVYRVVGPLVDHHLIRRDAAGRFHLSIGLVELAARVRPRLQEVAREVLATLAQDLNCTAALTVRDGEEAVVVAVEVPRTSNLHVSYRVGMRHEITRGAPGLALLAASEPRENERPEVVDARERGWSRSSGELLAGATGVAVAVPVSGLESGAAISAVWIDGRDAAQVAVPLQHAAQRIATGLT